MDGETIKLEDDGDKDIVERVIESSRERYAKKFVPPEPKEKPKEEDAKPTTKAAQNGAKQTTQPRDRLKPTVYQMAAKWMMSEIDRAGFLKQEVAAHYIDDKFGGDCIE